MTTDIKEPPEPTAASLVSGIPGDLHHLVEQQDSAIRALIGMSAFASPRRKRSVRRFDVTRINDQELR